MCLAVPGEILSIDESNPLIRNARVSFGGVIKEVSLALTPEAVPGQYALVHAGLAISVVDEEEAAKILADLELLAKLNEAESPLP
jgi:hydrogenase expression/formation protein HypC